MASLRLINQNMQIKHVGRTVYGLFVSCLHGYRSPGRGRCVRDGRSDNLFAHACLSNARANARPLTVGVAHRMFMYERLHARRVQGDARVLLGAQFLSLFNEK